MKGISAVISVVLILMITVALASMAYVWFTTVFRTITVGTEEAAIGGITAMATKFTIESAKFTGTNTLNVSVRNTGTQKIDKGTFAMYINDVSRTYTTISGDLLIGGTETFTYTNTTTMGDICNNGIVKMTEATGYEAYATIKC